MSDMQSSKKSPEFDISIVIPAFNEEYLITKSLDALGECIDQLDYRIQVIVVDNASTDKTAEIAESYSFVTVVPEPRKSLVQARDTGQKHALANIVAHIDADNIVSPEWFTTLWEEMKNEDVVAVTGPCFFYDLSPYKRFAVSLYTYLTFAAHVVGQHIFRRSAVLQGGNFVLRKDAFESVGGFNPDDFVFYGEDADVGRRLVSVGRIRYLLKMKIQSSGRRLANEGLLRVGSTYALNFIWVAIFKKPFTKDFTDVRPEQG